MQYTQAKRIADQLVTRFTPYCERVAIAGSVRRGKAEPKDIELVAVPRMGLEQDLLGNPLGTYSLLDDILPSVGRMDKGGPRYKQFWLPEEIYLDLFIVLPPAQWGVIYTIRTGPGDFSQWIVTPRQKGGALPSYLTVHEGVVWNRGEALAVPEEADFFRLLGLEWIEPCERRAQFRTSLQRSI